MAGRVPTKARKQEHMGVRSRGYGMCPAEGVNAALQRFDRCVGGPSHAAIVVQVGTCHWRQVVAMTFPKFELHTP